MVLFPFLRIPEYYEFFKASKKYKMLDNGLFETGEACPFDVLIEAAKDIKADEIVLPDVRDKSKETIKRAKECLRSMSREDRKRFKVMVVCQAKTANQQIRRYPDYARLDVDVLGIMRPLKRHIIDRAVSMRWLQVATKFDVTKEHHFLGLDDPTELKLVRGIRSVDTSWPVRYGFVGKYLRIAKSMPKWLTPKIDFEQVLPEYILKRAQQNAEVLQEYAK